MSIQFIYIPGTDGKGPSNHSTQRVLQCAEDLLAEAAATLNDLSEAIPAGPEHDEVEKLWEAAYEAMLAVNIKIDSLKQKV